MQRFMMVGAVLALALGARAQEGRDEEIEELEREMEELAEKVEVLEGLAAGLEALEALGRDREAEMLRGAIRDVREGRERRDDREQRTLEWQNEVLRTAFRAFEGMDGRKHDAIRDALEHAIHARELRLEGARHADARRVLRTQPGEENLIEIMRYAEKFLRERKQMERARFLDRALDEWQGGREPRRRDEAMHALEIAFEALAGDDERTRRIRRMLGERMEQRRAGKEWSREQTGQVLEILHHCERLLRERERGDAADVVHRYREGLHARWKREPRGDDDLAGRVAQLEKRMDRIAGLLERVVRELEERRE